MSRGTVQRKSSLKKRNSSIGERFSDDETHRRRPCYQLMEKEKQRKSLPINDILKNKNQLNILREILLHERNIDKVLQKTNRSEKFIPKTNGIKKTNYFSSSRPASAKNLNSSSAIDWNQSDDDNVSVNFADKEAAGNESIRLNRSSRKDDHQYPMIRSASLYSQSRQPSNGIRSINNVSFISDVSKINKKSNDTESTLLDQLSSELNNLELITGFKSNQYDSSSNTCSIVLATALITLIGHIKQYTSKSKGKQELNTIKDQLSIVIKSQLDFQQKIENQMTTLQTMMQTICQLVNSEIISNKKCQTCTSYTHQIPTSFEKTELHQNWLNNIQRPYSTLKDTSNAMNELLMFTRRMNSATPIDSNLHRQTGNNSLINRHSTYIENLETSKKLIQPTLSMSTNDNDISKYTQQRKNIDQDARSSMISPIDVPLSYDIFESGLPNGNSLTNIPRNGINGLSGTSTTVPTASLNETILEKILQERLRLVQQMAELNKQHEMTQEELSNLEAKTIQLRPT